MLIQTSQCASFTSHRIAGVYLLQVSGTDSSNNGVRVRSMEVEPGQTIDPVTVVIRGGEQSCYGSLVLPLEALGTDYYTICAGYSRSGETSQVL